MIILSPISHMECTDEMLPLTSNQSKSLRLSATGGLLLVVLLTVLAPTQAATWFIKPDGTGQGDSWANAGGVIQAVIHSATAGDEIWVASGTYVESVSVTASLALYGGFAGTEASLEERDLKTHTTIIDASGQYTSAVSVSGCGNALVDGFFLMGGSGPVGGGIAFSSVSSATLSHCNVAYNSAEYGGGIFVGESSLFITGCEIGGNSADFGGGIYFYLSDSIIENCTSTSNFCYSAGGGFYSEDASCAFDHCALLSNSATMGGGGFCSGSSSSLTHSTVVANAADRHPGGFGCFNSEVFFTNSILWNHAEEVYGIDSVTMTYCCVQGGYPGIGNINADPLFVNPAMQDYRLQNGSPCIDAGIDQGSPYQGTAPDLGVWEAPSGYTQGEPRQPHVWYVNASAPEGGDGLSWATAVNGIYTPVLMGIAGDEIWVASGTYHEALILSGSPSLYGGFNGTEASRNERDWDANPTIIDASGLNSSVVRVVGTTLSPVYGKTSKDLDTNREGTTLDGFTLTGGNSQRYGGGIYYESVQAATLANCIIKSNTSLRGGGICCLRSNLIMDNCQILDNLALIGAGICCYHATMTVTANMISGNTAMDDGGGLYFLLSKSDMTSSSFIENHSSGNGGGIFCESSELNLNEGYVGGNMAKYGGGGIHCITSTASLKDYRIMMNYANNSGGMYINDCSPTLEKCWIGLNLAGEGTGGLGCEAASPVLKGCTISGNISPDYGGGIYCYLASPVLTNCTLEGNTSYSVGGGIYCASATPVLNGCLVNSNNGNLYGGGVFCYASSPTLNQCMISDNYACFAGGGFFCTGFSEPILNDCAITRNFADYEAGGTIFENSAPVLNGCWITHNTSPFTACGIWVFSNPTLSHCTLAGNKSIYSEGGIYHMQSMATFTNCILWNPGAESRSWISSVTMTHCCVQGGFPGAGNIEADPLFVDLAGDDFHLQNGSPCIDAGIDQGGPYNGSAPDMGAWEAPASYTQGPSRPPRVWYVNASAPAGGDGSSWAAALNTISTQAWSSVAGDEIWVASGTYYETPCLSDGLSLYGGFAGSETSRSQRDWAANPTIIDATGVWQSVVTIMDASDVILDGFTITNGHTISDGGGVYCTEVHSVTISHCTITHNQALNQGGGVFAADSSVALTDCWITSNTSLDGGGVISIGGSSTLENCTISGNTASEYGGGVYSGYNNVANLTHCTIVDNRAGYDAMGVDLVYSSTTTLTNCILWNPGSEISLFNSSVPVVTHCCVQGGYAGEGNIDAYPLFVDPTNEDWWLSDGSPCIDRGLPVGGMTFNGSAPDIGAWESPDGSIPGNAQHTPLRLYVNQASLKSGEGLSWNTAFHTMNEALWICSVSDEIWVARGTYHESLRLEQNVSIFGGFIGNETVLSQRDWTVNPTIVEASGSSSVVVIIGSVENPTLDGFTLTGGGNGVYFTTVHSATLSNCLITGNTSTIKGAGVYCWNASPMLKNCTITGNTSPSSGGGLYCESSAPELLSCILSNNKSANQGGGVYCDESAPAMKDCTITANSALYSGGGMYCNASAPVMDNCMMNDNTSTLTGGGLYITQSAPGLANCIIAGNTASQYGGGAYCSDSAPALTNCTIVNNAASLGIGGVFITESSATLANCILWNASEEIQAGSSTTIVTYCCIQGGYSGTGNNSADPLIVDVTNGNYSLRSTSPCIDAGNPDANYNDGCLPPGQGSVRNDMGYTGGPGNCGQGGEVVPTPTPTMTPKLPTPTPTPTMPVISAIWHLKPGGTGTGKSWEQAAGTIQEVINSATSGDEIWVASGTYHETLSIPFGLGVYGGFKGTESARDQRNWTANETVIDASGLNHVAVTLKGQQGITLDGFTVTGGYGGSTYPDNCGGGVSFYRVSSATLANCVIAGNRVPDFYGGGVYCYASSPLVRDCTITGNSAKYGGGGLAFDYGSSGMVTNCLITGNTSLTDGGGVTVNFSGSSPTFVNCTIAGNRSNKGSGLYCQYEGSSTLVNCILWNQGGEVTLYHSENVSATYSCVQGGYQGEGNIDAYPQFVNPDQNDWRLRDGSPCIDRGKVQEGMTYHGSAPDMGACESSEGAFSGVPTHTPLHLYVNGSAVAGGNGQSWDAALRSLDEALWVCSVSDEIWVAKGAYQETIGLAQGSQLYGGFVGGETSRDQRNPTTNPTILDANGSLFSVAVIDSVDGITLDGFTLTGGMGGGVTCHSCYSAYLTNLFIIGNSSWDVFCGVTCYFSSPTLNRCTIVRNSSNYSGGVFASNSSPTLTNCILWNPGAELYPQSSRGINVNHCCVQGGYKGEGNINAYPLFVDPDGNDWRLSDGSPCIDRGTISAGLGYNGSAPDMGAWESPEGSTSGTPTHTPLHLYVNRAAETDGDGLSWATAFRTLNEALWVCSVSDEIWATKGTYPETIQTEQAASLYGGFVGNETESSQRNPVANPTILDASQVADRFVALIGNTEDVTIDGFTFMNGNGGGVSFANVASATMTNCTITGNTGTIYTGGVFVLKSSPRLENCTITNNTTSFFGGGLCCQSSSPVLNNCVINGNRSSLYGGGAYISDSNPVLTDCIISGNSTSRSGGGMYFDFSSYRLMNCVIAGNTVSRYGGGIYSSYSESELENCTIVDNMAPLGGSGLLSYYETLRMTNSILWNPAGDLYLDDAAPIITYSCIREGYAGTGNISLDPLIVDATQGDFTLQSNSPCIDAGNPDEIYNDGCLPPGQGTVRNDMGYTGGPGNCGQSEPVVPTPTPTMTPEGPTPTPTQTPVPSPDLNGDGMVTVKDLLLFEAAWGNTTGGDFNSDGVTNHLDLLYFSRYWYE